MSWSRDDEGEKWKQTRKTRDELHASDTALAALTDDRMSDIELPEARYEEFEKRRSNHEVRNILLFFAVKILLDATR